MTQQLTASQRRWLAVALLVLFLALLSGAVALPWFIKLSAYNAQIEQQEGRLQRYAANFARPEKVREEVEKVKRRLRSLGIFNANSTGALAVAEMQQKIKDAIIAAGGNLMSTQAMAEEKVEGLTRILVKVRFSGRVETLKDVLYVLESSTPYMLVENLQVTSVRGTRNPKTRQVEAVDKVNVSMDVGSFMQAKVK